MANEQQGDCLELQCMVANDQQQASIASNKSSRPRVKAPTRCSSMLTMIRNKNIWIFLSLLLLISCSVLILTRHHSTAQENTILEEKQELNAYEGKDDADRWIPKLRSPVEHGKTLSSAHIGHTNIYITKDRIRNHQQNFQLFRFPVARYDRRRNPLKSRLLSFMPQVPIFADRLTKQTIVYCSSGIYVIPPLVDIYGRLFSIAELIAEGYASLVSTGIPPTSTIDMARFFYSDMLVGPEIPVFNQLLGRFSGGIPTEFRSFSTSQYSETKPNIEGSSELNDKYDQDNVDGDDDNNNDRYEAFSLKSYKKSYKKKYVKTPAPKRIPPSKYAVSGCTDVALRSNLPSSFKMANITIFTDATSAPFVSRIGNGVPFGFDIELMTYISCIYRIDFNYQYATFRELIPLIQNNKNAISIGTHTITIARIELVDFVQFFKTGSGFIARSTYNEIINGLPDLCGKTVGVQSGTIQERDVQQRNTECPSNNKITIVAVITHPEVIELVRNGNVDVSVYDQAVLITDVLESNNQLKIIGQPYDIQPYGIICNKENRPFCCALVNVINYLIQEGIYEKLLQRYSFSYINNGVCPSRINLQESTCEEKCAPSESTCKDKID